jgi:glycosyltransferase involved in cell wall biosynthesis
VELSPSGGIFQFSFQLGSHLASNGHNVELLTGPEPELASDTIRFRVRSWLPTWHPGSATLDPSWVRRPRRALRAIRHVVALGVVLVRIAYLKPDVVLWHPLRFPIDSWGVVLANRLSRRSAMCIIMHEHRPLAEQRRSGSFYRASPLQRRALQAAVNRMNVIFVLSDRVRQQVVDTWRSPGRVVVIPHGNEDAFLTADHLLPVSSTGQKILFFGTWTRHKGIPSLIEAFRIVRQRAPAAQLTVAGAVGGDVDYNAIERLAVSVGGIHLAPGYVPLSDVRTLFEQARVVAIPYLRANQSGVAHLAQTFGRPVVATAVGDIPESVPHGEAGLIVPPDRPDAMAEALLELLHDPALAGRLGAGGHDRLRREGSWSGIAEKIAEAAATPQADACAAADMGTQHR